MSIEMVTQTVTRFWAILPTDSSTSSIRRGDIGVWVDGNDVCFSRAVTSMQRPTIDSLRGSVRSFCLAVRRLAREEPGFSIPFQGRFVKLPNDRVQHITRCGEARTFTMDDLLDLVEWIRGDEVEGEPI